MQLGYNDDWNAYPRRAATAASGGAQLGRFGVSLQQVWGSGWNYADSFADVLVAAGVRPMISVQHPMPPDLPRDQWPGAYAAFAVAVGQRYPSALLEGWNEPNLQPRFGDLSPQECGRLYLAAADALGGRKLISPALSPRRGWERWLKDMRLPLDVPLGLHPYPGANTPPAKQRAEVVRQIDVVRGLGYRNIWVTEVGISTGDGYASEQQQCDLLTAIWRECERRNVRSCVVHRLGDVEEVWAGPWERGCGTMRLDGSPKPAFSRLRSAASS